MDKVRVLLADDHGLMRDGLRGLLSAAGIEVVAEVADGREAVSRVQELRPDVVLMDIAMPGLNGIEAARLMKEKAPQARVVMLSMHGDAEHLHRALDAGALGYLLKESAAADLIAAVRAAAVGQRYLSEPLEALARRPRSSSPLASLSSRERQVLQLVVEGKSSAEIGRIVYLSPKTVETYRSRLMRKLGVKDLAALVKFALQHGLTPPG